MKAETKKILIEWLEFFGESENRIDDLDICDDGSVWLGLEMVAPKGTV